MKICSKCKLRHLAGFGASFYDIRRLMNLSIAPLTHIHMPTVGHLIVLPVNFHLYLYIYAICGGSGILCKWSGHSYPFQFADIVGNGSQCDNHKECGNGKWRRMGMRMRTQDR